MDRKRNVIARVRLRVTVLIKVHLLIMQVSSNFHANYIFYSSSIKLNNFLICIFLQNGRVSGSEAKKVFQFCS